ncbi:unnamed protein product, partial [marine sediment metagenome]
SLVPVPSINTIKNTADIVKASNSHLGVCFDVDGSRLLVVDENGLEISFEDILMLFVAYDKGIQKSKNSTIITTPYLSRVVKDFIKESGHPLKLVENYPGELSRQIRQERACFAAADSLKFYFPTYSPISDGNYTLLKILEIMAFQKDLISSLTKGFPKGIKVNKTIPVSSAVLETIHNRLIEFVDEHNLKYQDIINGMALMHEINKFLFNLYKEKTQNLQLNNELFEFLEDKIGSSKLEQANYSLIEEFPPDIVYKEAVKIEEFLKDEVGGVENEIHFVDDL